jgi:hypothetical protein
MRESEALIKLYRFIDRNVMGYKRGETCMQKCQRFSLQVLNLG